MKNSIISSIKTVLQFTLVFLIILSFSNCKKTQEKISNQENTSSSTSAMLPIIKDSIPYLKKLFTDAMLDAQNPRPDKVFKNLLTIEGNNSLIDTIIEKERHVLMVSWKGDASFYPDSGAYNTGNKYDIWVSAAPIIKDSCISFYKKAKDPNMRLRQLLGLQPFTVETFFLEVWVKPNDLYRPCPDNETSDTACELNLPANATNDYRKWFNHTRAFQYNDCNDTVFSQYGYPWTQLGYTYDWSPDNPTHVGLSEFVIRRNKTIYVLGKHTTKKYCQSSY